MFKSLLYTIIGTVVGIAVGLAVSFQFEDQLGRGANYLFFICMIGGGLIGKSLGEKKKRPSPNIGGNKDRIRLNDGLVKIEPAVNDNQGDIDLKKQQDREAQKNADYWNDLNYGLLKSKEKYDDSGLSESEKSRLDELEREQISRITRFDS